MKRTSHALVVLSSLIITAASVPVEAANPVGGPSDKLEIRNVLLSETKDESVSVDRRAVLQPAQHSESASDAAWWQSAFVKIGGNWRPVEKSHLDLPMALLNEYHAQRDAAPKTPEGQLKLANWCRDQKLTDQERAHLTQMLVLSQPGIDRSPIYKRMGYRQIGAHWVSPADFESLMLQSQRLNHQIHVWTPAVERIVRNWTGTARQRKQAQLELDKIDDAEAIPALLMFAFHDESLALQICQRLGHLASFEASQAMACLAVHSESPMVRQHATDNLKGRKIDDFAAVLLSAMRSLFSLVQTSENPVAPRLIFREERDRFVAIDLRFVPTGTFELQSRVHAGRLIQTISTPSRNPDVTGVLSTQRAGIDTNRYIEDVAFGIQNQVDDENDRSDQLNSRSATTLAAVTGQQPSSNPQYWWAWWNLYTGTQQIPKRVEAVAAEVKLPPQIITNSVDLRNYHSCLVAGTPVWTEGGLVAVEQIQAGDRVLAKDIWTGRIEYKPVLHTTERPPVAVKRFVAGGESIVASDAHHFWVSGEGWTKTRELKSNQPIHTVSGMSRVQSVEDEPKPAPVYNLIVADFHTYFIGPAMILSHDVTLPEPTNIKVPGLLANQ